MTMKTDEQLWLNEIQRGMALAFFACAYADQADTHHAPLHGAIMDQLPEAIDPLDRSKVALAIYDDPP